MRKKILFYSSFVIIIVLSGFIWPVINLPYENTSIIGEYSRNKYNHNNDLIRYLLFIFIPILILFIFFAFRKTLSINNLLEKINTNLTEETQSKSK